jgi:radical SAM superfamily enzyme YgiQ (UPF0313 family)
MVGVLLQKPLGDVREGRYSPERASRIPGRVWAPPDPLNAMFLTPLPGTELWKKMELEGRIAANRFPEDWKYYTLTYPVAKYRHLSWADLIKENETCSREFYAYPRIMRRFFSSVRHRRQPWLTLVGNLSNRANSLRFQRRVSQGLDLSRGETSAATT